MQPFKTILARAAKRKGGEDKLAALLPKLMRQAELVRIPDDRVLAEMTKRIFSAGFAWTVIEAKWPGFEEAFLGFAPKRLLAQPDEYWEQLASDTRIVRNGAKIASVRANAAFIAEVSDRHGGFAKFLADWPPTDQIGLMDLLAKKGARLGGKTGQFFLRFLGKDAFVLSADVVACLRDAGLDIADSPSSKKDLRQVHDQFNAWTAETGLPLTHLSRICAMSIGENFAPEELAHRAGMEG